MVTITLEVAFIPPADYAELPHADLVDWFRREVESNLQWEQADKISVKVKGSQEDISWRQVTTDSQR